VWPSWQVGILVFGYSASDWLLWFLGNSSYDDSHDLHCVDKSPDLT